MREIATFDDERTARSFADVLCSREIETEISRGRSGSYGVWVLDERDVEASRAAWAAFDAVPDAPDHLAAAGCLERKQRLQARQRPSRHEVIDVRRRWAGARSGPPTVTLFLLVVSVLVTLSISLGPGEAVINALSIGTGEGQHLFLRVERGEVWRLVTPIFLHFGLLHILFNMWMLLDLGTILERRIGATHYSVIVLVSAILSNITQYVVTGSPAFGGMSGVLYALFGYVWVRGRFDGTLGFALRGSTVIVLMVWLVLGFTGTLGPVANFAHLGGLVAGAALGGREVFFSRR